MGALPYGDSPFGVRWQAGDLILCRDRLPQDVLLPQSDGSFLLRNMCSELRFEPAQATGKLLWTDKLVPLQRPSAAVPY